MKPCDKPEINIKYDDRSFQTKDHVSNGHWLVRKDLVKSILTSLEQREMDVSIIFPTEYCGLLVDTGIIYHKINCKYKIRLFKTITGDKVWLNEEYYTPFAKAVPNHELHAPTKGGPVMVTYSDEFIGFIMPCRQEPISHLA
jgi:hypothetical protein